MTKATFLAERNSSLYKICMKFVMYYHMRKFALAAFVISSAISASAQMNPGLKFNKLVHNFGSVKEESERVSTVFSFRNISDKPVYIVKVETSCGCTTPEYSKDTIMPGDTGFVKAIFETRGRHGDFHKNLFVHFNMVNFYQSLIISGTVIPEANLANRPRTYTTTYSNLAFNSTMAEFPNLRNNQVQSYKIKAFNYMGYPIRIYDVTEKPDYVSLDLGDSLIDVNDSIIITVTVDGSKVGSFGELRRRIALLTDDPGGSVKFLHVYTNIKEDFSKLSKKELKNAPVISLSPGNPINLGKHTAGEKFKYVIKISNTGKTPLNIRSLIPNCSCITYSIAKQTIEPGETISLTLTIDTVNQSIASHTKYITLYSNDPVNPEIRIKLTIDITN